MYERGDSVSLKVKIVPKSVFTKEHNISVNQRPKTSSEGRTMLSHDYANKLLYGFRIILDLLIKPEIMGKIQGWVFIR